MDPQELPDLSKTAERPVASGGWSFGLDTLLLWIALAGILMAVFKTSPEWGCAAAGFCFMAALRTVWMVSKYHRESGRRLPARRKISCFASSLAIAVLLLATFVATIVAVFAVIGRCVQAVAPGYDGFAVPIASAVVGIFLVVFVTFLAVRYSRRRE